jgi:hypothetical protein
MVYKNDHPDTNSVMSIKHQLYSVNMLQPIIWSSAGGMIDPHNDHIVGYSMLWLYHITGV